MKSSLRVLTTATAAIALVAGLLTPAASAAVATPQISKMVRQELLIPGTSYTDTGNSQIDHSVLLKDGGIAVCGFFSGTRKFGKTTIKNLKSTKDTSHWWQQVDPFVAKADASGKWVWAVSVAATKGGSCRTMSVKDDGTIRVRVNLEGTSKFAGRTLSNVANADVTISSKGKALAITPSQAEPQATVANTNLYAYTPLDQSPAFVGGKVTDWVTFWNINGTTTPLDLTPTEPVEGDTYPWPGVLGKKVGDNWAWVVGTPGTTQPASDFAPVATSDGGVVISLFRSPHTELKFAGFTATTGDNALAKFDANGQPVWGFEVPHRRITAYTELANHYFAITQGVESAFQVAHFKLQIYNQNASLVQSLSLPGLAFPPRKISFTGSKSTWLQTGSSVILLKAKP